MWEPAASAGGGGAGTLATVSAAGSGQADHVYTNEDSNIVPIFRDPGTGPTANSLWLSNSDTAITADQEVGSIGFYSHAAAESGASPTSALGAAIVAVSNNTHSSTNRGTLIEFQSVQGTGALTPVLEIYKGGDGGVIQWPVGSVGQILGGATSSEWGLAGGNNDASGGTIRLYGTGHATKPDILELRSDANVRVTVGAAGTDLTGPVTLTPQSATPGSPAAGMLYYDSDDDEMYLYDGTSFNAVGGGGADLGDLAVTGNNLAATDDGGVGIHDNAGNGLTIADGGAVTASHALSAASLAITGGITAGQLDVDSVLRLNNGVVSTLSGNLTLSPFSNTVALGSSVAFSKGATIHWTAGNNLQNFVDISGTGNLTMGGDVTAGSGSAYYIGDSATDGTWRFIRSGDDLLIQQRESGTYNTKSTISGA
jgi:hypothetical protein